MNDGEEVENLFKCILPQDDKIVGISKHPDKVIALTQKGKIFIRFPNGNIQFIKLVDK